MFSPRKIHLKKLSGYTTNVLECLKDLVEVQFSNLAPWKIFFPFLPWNSCLQRQLCLEKSVKVKTSISMNFVAKCCQPPGILGDFAVDCWKFIDFIRPGILRPSPCTDKKWNSPLSACTAHCQPVLHIPRVP